MIKTNKEISKMREAGRLAAEALVMIEGYIKPGISTEEIDSICHDYIVTKQNARPACLGYKGFPKSVCTSVNSQICHGIPGPYQLMSGDILNVDITVEKNGYHGDTSKMFGIGELSLTARRVMSITSRALFLAIAEVRPGMNLNTVGRVIQKYAEHQGFSVVEDYTGHGIGQNFHEDPVVLHYYNPHAPSITLEPGMTFTIEPMINVGKKDYKILSDGWTVVTKDGTLSAQYEHTILVTKNGAEILTKV